MWVFLNDAMVSIVRDYRNLDLLLVRSRIEGDVQRAIPGAEVIEHSRPDWKYTTTVSRSELKDALANAVDRLNYFDYEASLDGNTRHRAMVAVFGALSDAYPDYQHGAPFSQSEGLEGILDPAIRTYLHGDPVRGFEDRDSE